MESVGGPISKLVVFHNSEHPYPTERTPNGGQTLSAAPSLGTPSSASGLSAPTAVGAIAQPPGPPPLAQAPGNNISPTDHPFIRYQIRIWEQFGNENAMQKQRGRTTWNWA